jgi:hypothetical protein
MAQPQTLNVRLGADELRSLSPRGFLCACWMHTDIPNNVSKKDNQIGFIFSNWLL